MTDSGSNAGWRVALRDALTGVALKCLLKRTPLDKSGAINLNDLSNDYVFVILYIEEAGHRLSYVLRGVQGANLICEIKPLETWVRKDLPIRAFWENDRKLRYFYRGWTIIYDDLREAFVDICLRKIALRRARQSSFDKRLRIYNDRIGWLKHAIDAGRGTKLRQSRRVHELCVRVYGERFENSEKAYDSLEEAKFMLGSFLKTGEVVSDDPPNALSTFTITPKAFETLAAHELEMVKHRGQMRAALGTAWATLALVLVTAVLVWVTWEMMLRQGQ